LVGAQAALVANKGQASLARLEHVGEELADLRQDGGDCHDSVPLESLYGNAPEKVTWRKRGKGKGGKDTFR